VVGWIKINQYGHFARVKRYKSWQTVWPVCSTRRTLWAWRWPGGRTGRTERRVFRPILCATMMTRRKRSSCFGFFA